MSDRERDDGLPSGSPEAATAEALLRQRRTTRQGKRRSLRVPVDDVPRRPSVPGEPAVQAGPEGQQIAQAQAGAQALVAGAAAAAVLPLREPTSGPELVLSSDEIPVLSEDELSVEDLGRSYDAAALPDFESEPTRVAQRRPSQMPPAPARTSVQAMPAATPAAAPIEHVAEPALVLDDSPDPFALPAERTQVELVVQPAAEPPAPAPAAMRTPPPPAPAAIASVEPPVESARPSQLPERPSQIPAVVVTGSVVIARAIAISSPPPPPTAPVEAVPAASATPMLVPDSRSDEPEISVGEADGSFEEFLVDMGEIGSERARGYESPLPPRPVEEAPRSAPPRDSAPELDVDELVSEPAAKPVMPPPPPRGDELRPLASGEEEISADEIEVDGAAQRSAPPPPPDKRAVLPTPPPPPLMGLAPVAAAAPAAAPAAAATPAASAPAAESPAELRRAPKKKGQWWEDFFNDDYLRTVPTPTPKQIARQCAFIEQRLGLKRGATILDVGCGLGLHAIELTRRGYLVVGLDLSLPMLSRAADEAQDEGFKINFLHADMREMNFDGAFDAVICWGTTFGYFDDEANRNVVERLYRALKPRGLLLLDVVNRDYVVRSQPNLVWFEGDGCVVMEETHCNYITSRLHVKRTVILDDGRQRDNLYSVRLYALHELGHMLHLRGFRVVEVSGREASPGVFFGADSPRLIILAERRALEKPPTPPRKSTPDAETDQPPAREDMPTEPPE